MASFEVAPAIELAAASESHGLIRTLTGASLKAFKKSAWSKRKGVFVFGLRNQGGTVTPWYVGLAKKQSFADEATSADKLRKYAVAMFGRTGTPIMTLVAAPKTGPKGPVDSLETLLIWIARAQNPRLVNERKIGSKPRAIIALVNEIQIDGVLKKSQGKPSTAAKAFRSMMGL
jgi:hypothetical protein